MTSDDDRRDRIESEATEWLVLQTSGLLHPADELAFELWLNHSPQHRATFQRMRQTWDGLAVLQQQPGDLLRHTAGLPRSRPVRRWAAPAFALAACLLLVIGLSSVWLGNPLIALLADYRTASGEIRSIRLPDGSRVDLGPSTALALQFSGTERRVALLEGRAFFSPAPQAQAGGRPFIVETGTLAAQALGTQFLVERQSEGDTVAVVEHTVEVRMREAAQPAVLSPGQSLRYRRGGSPAVSAIDPLEVAPWRSGNLVFYQVALRDVVAELNRYRRDRIVIAGEDLSGRIVSGVFRIADPDGAVRTIVRELDADSMTLPFLTIIRK